MFQGSHAYISLPWFADRTQAPTWNYAVAALSFEFEEITDPEELRLSIERLVAVLEQGRTPAWSEAEMGQRYEQLARHIVGFRGWVRNERAKFKLGQDERLAVTA